MEMRMTKGKITIRKRSISPTKYSLFSKITTKSEVRFKLCSKPLMLMVIMVNLKATTSEIKAVTTKARVLSSTCGSFL
jgi:hypothetical protein